MYFLKQSLFLIKIELLLSSSAVCGSVIVDESDTDLLGVLPQVSKARGGNRELYEHICTSGQITTPKDVCTNADIQYVRVFISNGIRFYCFNKSMARMLYSKANFAAISSVHYNSILLFSMITIAL